MVRPSVHDEECDVLLYGAEALCTCTRPAGNGEYEGLVYGEDASPHDGRLSGPALDW